MKKIVFNNEELRDKKLNFNVFCLMQLDAEEQEEKLELCTRNMKSFRYGFKLGRKDIYNIFDECGYIREKCTILRREEVTNNGVFARYTYLSFSYENRNIVEVEERELINIVSNNNAKLTKLYLYLLLKTADRPIVISQKELLLSIGLSPRSEGSLKKMTELLVKDNLLKINKFRDSKGIKRIEYRAY